MFDRRLPSTHIADPDKHSLGYFSIRLSCFLADENGKYLILQGTTKGNDQNERWTLPFCKFNLHEDPHTTITQFLNSLIASDTHVRPLTTPVSRFSFVNIYFHAELTKAPNKLNLPAHFKTPKWVERDQLYKYPFRKQIMHNEAIQDLDATFPAK